MNATKGYRSGYTTTVFTGGAAFAIFAVSPDKIDRVKVTPIRMKEGAK